MVYFNSFSSQQVRGGLDESAVISDASGNAQHQMKLSPVSHMSRMPFRASGASGRQKA